MSDTRNPAPPGGRPDPDDATTDAPAPEEAADLAARDGRAQATDDTPTIISRNGPRSNHEDPAQGLRGRRLAHFELIEPIGVGGMAAVIRARDTQLDRLVALKILPPDMAADPENVRRFHQEARSAARLDHENVARVFFCGEDQSLYFIAFEFVEGDNLRTILERRGRLPVAEALHYILQVAAGLAHAAGRGVVHRDIKPSNIIITPTGRAKLVDMGLARSLERQDDQALTQSGVTLGTFDYISPEQALEPREADVRSDIYSLGCTLYHVLTGHPPVPEGTAAKKLHHHQHVKPRDPRELVPGLPDEVAVILDRMMAKKPQDRYQSPEQLVHHLLLAARKLGSSPNMPEGVLSVEAALPPPPGGRPLLTAGLAVALVVVLIVALEVFNRTPAAPATPGPLVVRPEPPRNDRETAPSDNNPPASIKDKAPEVKEKPPAALSPPTVVAPVAYDDSVNTQSLAEWLQSSVPAGAPISIQLSGDVDLDMKNVKDRNLVGLALSGPQVTIQAKSPGRRPTIHMTYDGGLPGANPWAAVTIDSPAVVVKGVRFLVDGTASDVGMVGLRLRGPADKASFLVDNCEFIQARSGTGKGDLRRLASLEVAGSNVGATKLTLNGCRFSSFKDLDGDTLTNPRFGGHDAVVREGPVNITATDCAFGPHAAVFRLEGGKGTTAPSLALEHCSVLASGLSAVFDVRGGAAVALDLHACLFSHPDGSAFDAAPAETAVLIRQADADGNAVACVDGDNRYHGFDAFWVVGDGAAADWANFQDKAAKGGKTSSLLTGSVWKNDPFEPFREFNYKEEGAENHFVSAFQINDARPDLRVAPDKGVKPSPVGVRTLGGVDYAAPLVEADRLAAEASLKQRTVDPTRTTDNARRLYTTLEEALAACELGDAILLRWDGPRDVEPIRLGTAKLQDVTLRPDAGRHPILKLKGALDRDPEPALFHVYDGKLQLEGLEFLLQPAAKFPRQTLVDLAGQGQCNLLNCVVTLNRSVQEDTRLSMASLSDAGRAMMPTPAANQGPQLTLDGCFVRGDGDLVSCQTSRPWSLKATNTLAALKGSFLNVEVGPDASTVPAGPMTLTLNRVTTYLAGNLIHLHGGKDYRALAPVHCLPTDCLFVTAREGQSLIHLDEFNADQNALQKVLVWEGWRTVYGNYGTILDQTPPDGEMPRTTVSMNKWESSWDNNMGKPSSPFKFTGPIPPPSAESAFTTAVPSQFRPDPGDGGADVKVLEQLLAPASPK